MLNNFESIPEASHGDDEGWDNPDENTHEELARFDARWTEFKNILIKIELGNISDNSTRHNWQKLLAEKEIDLKKCSQYLQGETTEFCNWKDITCTKTMQKYWIDMNAVLCRILEDKDQEVKAIVDFSKRQAKLIR